MKTSHDLLKQDSLRSAVAFQERSLVAAKSTEISAKIGEAAVERSAFSAAFIRGADLDGPNMAAGKLLNPYAQSAWVHRAVKLKVDEITGTAVKFYAGKNEFIDPAFLAWWENPFLSVAGQPLPLARAREQLGSWPDLEGEFFILLGDDWLLTSASRRWQSLSKPIIARPDRLRHVVQQGKLMGWVFTDAANHQYTLLPDQVIHSPLWNPYDDFRGLATVKAVFNAAESDYLAGVYVRNLMRNNGDQGAYVIGKGGMPDEAQREQIVGALREKRAKSLRGDFAPVFLTGDIAVEDAQAKSTDGDFNNGRLLNRHEIFIGMGVPPSMADVKASYSIGADSDRFTLITGSCMPLAKRIDDALGMIASKMVGRVITVASDWDDHPVIQNVRRGRIDGALKLWPTGISWEFLNRYLDLGMTPFPGWDVAYLPFNVAPIGSDEPQPQADTSTASDPTEDPNFSETQESDDNVKVLRSLLLSRMKTRQPRCESAPAMRTDEFAMFTCAHCEEMAIQRADRPAHEVAQWKTLIAQRRSTVKSFQSSLGRILMKARVDTLRRISQYHPDATKAVTEQKAAAATFLFNLAEFVVSFHGAMENQQKAALETAGQQLFDELERDDVFKYPPAKALEYLRARQNKLRDVPQDVYDRVKAQLEEGLNKGDTQEQLEKRVKGVFNEIADGQARTIALTETSAAYGAGRDAGMKQAGVRWKQWLTSGNSNVRPAHMEANGQTVSADEPFFVDGEELNYPGDDAGSPGNVINCHCISIAVASGPEE